MKTTLFTLAAALSIASACQAYAGGNAACWNPATGRLEPCLRSEQENLSAGLISACWDPVTQRPEPCFLNLQRSAGEALMNEACRDPVTGRIEPCF